jgi:hypothetical protein
MLLSKNKKNLFLGIIIGSLILTGLLVGVKISQAKIDCQNPSAYYIKDDGSGEIDFGKFWDVQVKCDLQDTGVTFSPLDILTGKGHGLVIGWMFDILNRLILTRIIKLEAMLIPWLMSPNTFQFASSPLVHAGWYMSLQIANMFLVLGMLILGNKVILGIESLGDYKKLIQYVIAAIIINFSLSLAGMAIGISNAITQYFTGLLGPGADITNRLLQMTSVYSAMMADTDNVLVVAFLLFLAINMMALLALIFGAILFTLVKRIIVLWIALIFLPIAYVMGTFNPVKIKGATSAWSDWQSQFMNALMFPPLMAFFLWFTFLVMNRARDLYSASNYDDQSWIQRLLQAAVFTGILVFGFRTANEASGKSAGFIGSLIEKTAKGWGLPEMTLKAGEQTFKKIGANINNRLLSTDAAKDLARTIETNPVLSRIPLLNRIPNTIIATQKKSEQVLKDVAQKHADILKSSLPKRPEDAAEFLVNTIQDRTTPKEVRAAAAGLLYSEEKYRKNIHAHRSFIGPGGAINTAKLQSFVDDAKTVARANGVEFKDDEIAKIYPTIKSGAELDKTVKDMNASELAASPVKTDSNIITRASKELITSTISRLKDTPDELVKFIQAAQAHSSSRIKNEIASDKSIQPVVLDNLVELRRADVTLDTNVATQEAAAATIQGGLRGIYTPSMPNPQGVVTTLRGFIPDMPFDIDEKLNQIVNSGMTVPQQQAELMRLAPRLRKLVEKELDQKIINEVFR